MYSLVSPKETLLAQKKTEKELKVSTFIMQVHAQSSSRFNAFYHQELVSEFQCLRTVFKSAGGSSNKGKPVYQVDVSSFGKGFSYKWTDELVSCSKSSKKHNFDNLSVHRKIAGIFYGDLDSGINTFLETSI